MSWIIDELNEENLRLKKENYKKDVRFNRLVSDFSEFITKLDDLNKELDQKENKIKELQDSIEMYRMMIKDFQSDVSLIYPDFRSRLKFLWSGRK